eukprot:scaffold29603_cov113-Phaeocystis_antarctica.AAC.1
MSVTHLTQHYFPWRGKSPLAPLPAGEAGGGRDRRAAPHGGIREGRSVRAGGVRVLLGVTRGRKERLHPSTCA